MDNGKVCPGCKVSIPDDAKTDLRTDLCQFCIADYERGLSYE